MKKLLFIILILLISFSIFPQEIIERDLLRELDFWDINLDFSYDNDVLHISDFYSKNYNDISFELFSTLNAILFYLRDLHMDPINLNLSIEYTLYQAGEQYNLSVSREWLISYILTKDKREQQDIFNRELLPIYNELENKFKTYQYEQVEQAIWELR